MDNESKAWALAIMKTLLKLEAEVAALRGVPPRKGPDEVSEIRNRVRAAAHDISTHTILPL